MKRVGLIICLLFVVLFASEAFAGNIGLGVLSGGSVSAYNLSGAPVIRYIFSDKMKGDLGIQFGSVGGNSAMGILARGDFTVGKAGGVTMYIPLVIEYVSITDDDFLSGLTISAGFGAETYVAKNFSVGFDAYVFSFFSPVDGDASNAFLGTGRVMAHYYF
jgi:hypothetical protein